MDESLQRAVVVVSLSAIDDQSLIRLGGCPKLGYLTGSMQIPNACYADHCRFPARLQSRCMHIEALQRDPDIVGRHRTLFGMHCASLLRPAISARLNKPNQFWSRVASGRFTTLSSPYLPANRHRP